MPEQRLITRHLQPVLAELLADEPVVVLTGARTVGKSTLLAACAEVEGVQVLDLDDLPTRRAVAADLELFVGPTVQRRSASTSSSTFHSFSTPSRPS